MCSSHLRGVKLPKLLAQSLLLCRLLRPSGAREATRSSSRSGAARGAWTSCRSVDMRHVGGAVCDTARRPQHVRTAVVRAAAASAVAARWRLPRSMEGLRRQSKKW